MPPTLFLSGAEEEASASHQPKSGCRRPPIAPSNLRGAPNIDAASYRCEPRPNHFTKCDGRRHSTGGNHSAPFHDLCHLRFPRDEADDLSYRTIRPGADAVT